MTKFILTDGQKSAGLWSDDPSIWNFFSGGPKTTEQTQYARVAAAFRAYNLKANTVGNMPFALMQGEEEFDASGSWQNRVGFLPNPSELFRLDTLSYIASNCIYNLKTTDVLGRRQKGLYFAVPTNFKPVTDPVTGELVKIVRTINGISEDYKIEDPRLFRAWRLDHTTEQLPSPNTEALAIMNNAGVIYYADTWISHFYERGGIAPTVVAMKGPTTKEKNEDEAKSWDRFMRGLREFQARVARVINAEYLEVKQLGSSVTDLKNNEVYRQAIENIAMATGIPLSLLLSNSANYATAKEEKATWYENDIIPFCNWLAYEYNRQVFAPMGLRLEFRPETLDPQQEDETERAQALNTFADFLGKAPNYDMFIGMTDTFGYELSDTLVKAAEAYYKEKEKAAEEVRRQMANAEPSTDAEQPETASEPMPPQEQKPPMPPAKWLPSLAEFKELSVWQDVALRKQRKGESLDFEYQPHYGGLPESVSAQVRSALAQAATPEQVKAAFCIDETLTPTPEYKSDDTIRELAAAINRAAEVEQMKLKEIQHG